MADEPDDRHFIHRSVINVEYNDNVYQSSGIDEPVQDGVIFHYIPHFTFVLLNDKHEAAVNLSGDYREGLKTEVSDLNMTVNAEFGAEYNNGLAFRIEDAYSESRFDHEIYDRPGTYRVRSNVFQAETSFTPVERFSARGGYEYGWIDDEDVAARHQTYTAGVDIPVTWSAEIYADASRRDKSSDDSAPMNYINDRITAGIKWKGPYRFALSVEGGYERVDFDDPGYEDHENVRLKAGLDIKLTETSRGSIFVGTDVYENITYGAEFDHSADTDASTFLRIEKTTDMPYTTTRINPVYEMWRATAGHQRTFRERIDLTLEGGYTEWESYDTGTDLDGQKDETWSGSAALDYLLQEIYRIGAYYRYTKRNSTKPEYEYENNILGCSLSIDF